MLKRFAKVILALVGGVIAFAAVFCIAAIAFAVFSVAIGVVAAISVVVVAIYAAVMVFDYISQKARDRKQRIIEGRVKDIG